VSNILIFLGNCKKIPPNSVEWAENPELRRKVCNQWFLKYSVDSRQNTGKLLGQNFFVQKKLVLILVYINVQFDYITFR